MRIFKLAQVVDPKFLDTIKPQSLRGLAAEALKSPTFRDFEKNYKLQIKHGFYWHVTDDPNFSIDSEKGPRDMSSMGGGQMKKGKLMITSHLQNWVDFYGSSRPYAAEIDMSQVSPSDYYSVNRGFGNEFFVENPSMAKVVRVVPIKQALRIDRYKSSKIPQNQAELMKFYEDVNNKHKFYTESINI